MAVARVVRDIREMGLRVAVHKTEALYFYGRASGKPPETQIQVSGISILGGDRIKYLGLLLDGNWRFGHHFDAIASRVKRMSTALGRLLPNLRGPDGRIRRIYVGTINSVALYGAPVWAKELAAMRQTRDALRRIQRSMVARITRAYRTVSHAAVTILAGCPPLEFIALAHQQVYEREKELRRRSPVQTILDSSYWYLMFMTFIEPRLDFWCGKLPISLWH